jgi:replication factor A1
MWAAGSAMGARPPLTPQYQHERAGARLGPGFGQQGSDTTTSPSSKRVFPIKSLNPYQNKWMIRARVTSKTNIRRWNNSRGEGKVFSVDLLDESDEIRATAFNELVDKFYDVLEKGKVYFISRGSVRTANKKFTSIKNDYELHFNHETTIEPCLDDCNMPKMSYDFVEIKRIEDVPKDSVIGKVFCKTVDPKFNWLQRNVVRFFFFLIYTPVCLVCYRCNCCC